MGWRRWLLLPALAAAAACDDMATQPRHDPYERAALLSGAAVVPAPAGTVPFDGATAQPAVAVPPPTAGVLARGQRAFAGVCAPCHGVAGDGDGMAAGRYVPHPPSLHDDRLRAAPPAYVVRVIEEGFGRMPSHARQVVPAERWAVAWYVKALQAFGSGPGGAGEAATGPVPDAGATPLLRERLARHAAARGRVPSAGDLDRLARDLSRGPPAARP